MKITDMTAFFLDCRYLYSCGYSGVLSGRYICCQENLYEEATGVFWSFKEQKEVDEKTARTHWKNLNNRIIVKDWVE